MQIMFGGECVNVQWEEGCMREKQGVQRGINCDIRFWIHTIQWKLINCSRQCLESGCIMSARQTIDSVKDDVQNLRRFWDVNSRVEEILS